MSYLHPALQFETNSTHCETLCCNVKFGPHTGIRGQLFLATMRNKTSSPKRTAKLALCFLRPYPSQKPPVARHHNVPNEPPHSGRIDLLVMRRCGPPESSSGIQPIADDLLFCGLRCCKLPTERLRSAFRLRQQHATQCRILRPTQPSRQRQAQPCSGIRPSFGYPRPYLHDHRRSVQYIEKSFN